MNAAFETLLQERLYVFFIAVAVGLFASFVAWKLGYYRLKDQALKDQTLAHVSGQVRQSSWLGWKVVLGAFAVFLCVELIAVPSFYMFWLSLKEGRLVPSAEANPDQETQGWINLLGMVCTALALGLYYLEQNRSCRGEIWGEGHPPRKSWQVAVDMALGASTWLLAYPLIIAVSQVTDVIQQFVYQGPHADQVAVSHLKDIFKHPSLFWLTVVAIVTIVPCFEELLFRGFLQSWLKSLFGSGKSIIMTSILFASFHFSIKQGVENFELLISLFLLSCYLCFMRERQNSLWASIALHATFNGISLILLFYGDF